MMRGCFAALLLLAVATVPVRAAGLSEALAGRSVTCGLGPSFYFAPDGRTAAIVDFAEGAFPIKERTIALDAGTVRADAPDLFDLAVSGESKPVRYRFVRAKPGAPIALRIDADEVGDDCAVSRGRSGHVATRFNMIREALCGNDPLDACIAALRKACGAEPDAPCVERVRPKLRAINARTRRG